MPVKNVLILGASGRTGLACIRQFAALDVAPRIHAFCRNSHRLNAQVRSNLASTVQGDARSAADLEHALYSTRADTVLVAIGNGDDDISKQSDLRAENAKALVQVLQSQPAWNRIRIIVISRGGAKPLQVKWGLGIRRLMERHFRRPVLADLYTAQEEAAFAPIRNRVTIVRPTSLTQDAPTGHHLHEFGNNDEVNTLPTIKTDRADLAAWVVNEVTCGKHQGASVNVTGVKRARKQ